MNTILRNALLTVTINRQGAEIKHVILNSNQFEFMWQGDQAIWGRTAPILFPIVGRLKNNQYQHQGHTYTMTQHGFARDCAFEIIQQHPTSASFKLTSTPKSLLQYPFPFELYIHYQLLDNCLTCKWVVKNTGHEKMPFSIGAHPGFKLLNAPFQDYTLEFNADEINLRHLLTDGLFDGRTNNAGMEGKIIHLNSSLFDLDAIVLKKIKSKTFILSNAAKTHTVEMHAEHFPFFGIWSSKGCNEFVCLEPWHGLSDNVQSSGNLYEKEGIELLEAGKEWTALYSIKFTSTI